MPRGQSRKAVASLHPDPSSARAFTWSSHQLARSGVRQRIHQGEIAPCQIYQGPCRASTPPHGLTAHRIRPPSSRRGGGKGWWQYRRRSEVCDGGGVRAADERESGRDFFCDGGDGMGWGRRRGEGSLDLTSHLARLHNFFVSEVTRSLAKSRG